MKRGNVILIIGIIIVALAAVYFTFIYYPSCGGISCWESELVKCERVRYINDAPDITWQYSIKKAQDDNCIVNVKILKVKQGLTKSIAMEGTDMDCALPKGAIAVPESDITLCSGSLKEEMQTLIIEKLHQYILANVKEIGEEFKSTGSLTKSAIIINSTNSS
jgi:hypothetical protein